MTLPSLRQSGAILSLTGLCLTGSVCIAADSLPSSAHRVCKDDIAKLCPDVQAGGGRILACLKQNKDQVSPDCKKAIADKRGSRHRTPAKAAEAASNP